jgi:hypothetical protein
MHAKLEIIMPPVDNIEEAIAQIMAPFDENEPDNKHAFYDWYVIGGRYAGSKLTALFNKEKVDEFRQELINRKITVSAFQAGKEKIEPAAQIPMVDALWREFFPESTVKTCPLFAHYNDQYKNSEGWPDVIPLSDLPDDYRAFRVIIAGLDWKDDGTLEAKHMIARSEWNGVSHIGAVWDENVKSALNQYIEKTENYKTDYKEKMQPKQDWLVVTVDYHS